MKRLASSGGELAERVMLAYLARPDVIDTLRAGDQHGDRELSAVRDQQALARARRGGGPKPPEKVRDSPAGIPGSRSLRASAAVRPDVSHAGRDAGRRVQRTITGRRKRR